MASKTKTIEVDGEQYEYTTEKPWRDEELMKAIYNDTDLGETKIGEALGCSDATVHIWAKKHGAKELNTPPKGEPVPLNEMNGYDRWYEGQLGEGVLVHRLLAVAKYGYDAVTEMDVHHKNKHKFDNRHENIELRDHTEHATEHIDNRNDYQNTPWREEEKLREMYVEKKMSQQQIADKWGCNPSVIRKWRREHDIDKRSHAEAMELATEGEEA